MVCFRVPASVQNFRIVAGGIRADPADGPGENEKTHVVAYSTTRLTFGTDSDVTEIAFVDLDNNLQQGGIAGCLRTQDFGDLGSSLIFFAAVLAIPVCACVCLGTLGLYQKVTGRGSSRNRRRQDGNRSALRRYQGNPDIILSPTANGDNAEGQDRTTVRAVLETDDDQDFDEMVPVTTIQVNMENDRSADNAQQTPSSSNNDDNQTTR